MSSTLMVKRLDQGDMQEVTKGDTLIDSFTTDENGQFTTGYYVCDSDWTIREIIPSEGYLLDSTIHEVGAEPELYEIELNDTANDVTEQVIKGDIAIIKHTDDGGVFVLLQGCRFHTKYYSFRRQHRL